MRLADRAVLISGASGIAAATAHKVAAAGGRVFIVSLERDDCEALVSSIERAGGEVAHAVADLTDDLAATSALDQAMGFLGNIDGVFAAAGGSGRRFGDGPAHEISLDGWDQTFRINTFPLFSVTSKALARMRGRGGSVVIVSSVLVDSPSPELFATHAYASAKGAANAYVRALAAYYAGDGIRVNAIAPGLVRTRMSERAAADPETVAYAGRKQPLAGGFLEPEQIADAAVFLLSEEASQITGQVIAVDGGWGVTEA